MFLKVQNQVTISSRLVIIHQYSITELEMFVCMKLWMGNWCIIYLPNYFVFWFCNILKWHNYKNRGRKQSVSFEENPLKSLEDHLQKSISGLQEDILNIKDTIIQHFQESNLKSKKRLISLENEAVELEIKNNSLE